MFVTIGSTIHASLMPLSSQTKYATGSPTARIVASFASTDGIIVSVYLPVRLTVTGLPAAAVVNVLAGGIATPPEIHAKLPCRVRSSVLVVDNIHRAQLLVLALHQ